VTSSTRSPQMRTIYSKSLYCPLTPSHFKNRTSEEQLPTLVNSLQNLLLSFEF
jgi:hypothetical protein